MAHVSFEGVCCSDCVQPVANGDFSSLDYHYQQAEADQKMQQIERGMNHLCKEHGGSLHYGEKVKDFKRDSCHVCGARHAGEWHRIFILAHSARA